MYEEETGVNKLKSRGCQQGHKWRLGRPKIVCKKLYNGETGR